MGVLQDHNASRLFVGQLVSQVCDKMMSVGLVWMFTEHYPAFVIPCFLGVSALPHLLLAWQAGRWATRFGHVRTLIASDLARGVVFLALAAVWTRFGGVYALFTASFLANMASAVFNPAVMSAPVALVDPSLVQQLTALLESCFNVGSVVGPLLTALLYPWAGLRGLFLLNGLSYLWAAALETGLRGREAGDDAEAALVPRSTREVLFADPLITAMLAGFLASNLFLAPIMVIMPLFVKACYHGQLSSLAGLETAFGAGTIIGGMLLSAVAASRVGPKIAVAMVGVASAYLAFAASTTPLAGDASLVVLGFFLATANVLSMTVFQRRLPGPDVPTLMSLVNLISVASLPVSMVLMGFVVAAFDIRAIALVCAGGLALATLGVIARPDLRALR